MNGSARSVHHSSLRLHHFLLPPYFLLVQDVSDGSGLADFLGVEFAEDVAFGDVEAVDAGVEAVGREPEFGLLAGELAVFGLGAVGAELFEIDFDNVRGIGHTTPPFVGR